MDTKIITRLRTFKAQHNIRDIPIKTIEGYVYISPEYKINNCSFLVNKDIHTKDNRSELKISEYRNNQYVISKNGLIKPFGIPIKGNWEMGYALELHTLKSILLRDYGTTQRWDTIRPRIAEALFNLKYRGETSWTKEIAQYAADFLQHHLQKWSIDMLVPIPPSRHRRHSQPVTELAKSIGLLLHLPVRLSVLEKVKETPELKNIYAKAKRQQILHGAFGTHLNSCLGKVVLLFDDLYRSGATLEEATRILKTVGKAKAVHVLTITKTRAKR